MSRRVALAMACLVTATACSLPASAQVSVEPPNPPPNLEGENDPTVTRLRWSLPVGSGGANVSVWTLRKSDNGVEVDSLTFNATVQAYADFDLPGWDHVFSYRVSYTVDGNESLPSIPHIRPGPYPHCDPYSYPVPPPVPPPLAPRLYLHCLWPPPRVWIGNEIQIDIGVQLPRPQRPDVANPTPAGQPPSPSLPGGPAQP